MYPRMPENTATNRMSGTSSWFKQRREKEHRGLDIIDKLYTSFLNLLQWPSFTVPMLEIKNITKLIACLEDRIDVILGVCRTHAEPHSRSNERGGGVCDDDNNYRCSPSAHHPSEGGHLARIVNQEGNNRREWVTVSDKAKLLETRVKIPRIKSQAADAHASLRPVCKSGRKGYP